MPIDKNPFPSQWFGKTVIVFRVPGKSLFWTGGGFKDLEKVSSDPEEFENEEEANQKIIKEMIEFIRIWRPFQVGCVVGWDDVLTHLA